MDAREANVLLTRVALLDPRFGWTDEETQASRAETWADALADVSLEDALAAAVEHYRVTRDRLMPVDVVSRCPAVGDDGEAQARAEWLAARGLTEDDLARMTRAQLKELVAGAEAG